MTFVEGAAEDGAQREANGARGAPEERHDQEGRERARDDPGRRLREPPEGGLGRGAGLRDEATAPTETTVTRPGEGPLGRGRPLRRQSPRVDEIVLGIAGGDGDHRDARDRHGPALRGLPRAGRPECVDVAQEGREALLDASGALGRAGAVLGRADLEDRAPVESNRGDVFLRERTDAEGGEEQEHRSGSREPLDEAAGPPIARGARHRCRGP